MTPGAGTMQICPVHTEMRGEVSAMQERVGKLEGALEEISKVVERQSKQTWAILFLIATSLVSILVTGVQSSQRGVASLDNQVAIMRNQQEIALTLMHMGANAAAEGGQAHVDANRAHKDTEGAKKP
jgi:hypothetical protein